MLTGRSPVVHGITTNYHVLCTDLPAHAHVLERQGYRTGGFGKFHQTPMHMPVGDMTRLDLDESVVSEDPKWGPRTEWIKREHPEHYNAALALACPFRPNHPEPEDLERAERARSEVLVPLMCDSLSALTYPSPLSAELHDPYDPPDPNASMFAPDDMRRHCLLSRSRVALRCWPALNVSGGLIKYGTSRKWWRSSACSTTGRSGSLTTRQGDW